MDRKVDSDGTNAEASADSLYPITEGFVETASRDEVEALFSNLRSSLDALKGPRKDHAKKVQLAIARAEELLVHLLDVRDRLESERTGGKS